MNRILIAGVPATGKTTIGDYLRDRFNFRHFDVESGEANPNTSPIGKLFWQSEIDKLLEHLEKSSKNIVITWGFVCDNLLSLGIIDALQKRGFKFIWFHADEPLARTAFLERGTGDIRAFDIQMERIKRLDLGIFDSPVVVTTLDKNGRKDKDKIIEMIGLEKAQINR